MSQKSLRSSLAGLPVVGYILRLGWNFLRLPVKLDQMRAADLNIETSLQNLNTSSEQSFQNLSNQLEQFSSEVKTTLSDVKVKNQKLTDQVVALKHQQLSARMQPTSPTDKNSSTSELFADDHDLDDFYIKFENKFRGTEAEIKQRQLVYLPYFRKTGIDFQQYPVLDIGCGRGELLDLLKENQIRAIGLDINESMVQRCRDLGYEAVQAEALEYLLKQPAGSFGAITGFHIVEHIPFNFLLRLFEACYRALRPGGMVIFETPNPESLHVGSFSFYYDPSHLHPLVPDVLAFAIENRGFDKTEILRLHPKGDGHENDNRDDKYIAEVLKRFYLEQDYAVIGYRE